eukprot:CAMPEP_0182870980 /NCGR_PEP_ID=MMETSP0034_2-20130328/10854_1 /TAXON_ID=156128 /ORGANISM="Nephroselmis pyriformis, Strain CCMP717" /LENGTH=81 /DNA_ID=CAMNT_0025003501 /DNA_START=191 /DNA_END=432 /DNA_ORIENTATION=-
MRRQWRGDVHFPRQPRLLREGPRPPDHHPPGVEHELVRPAAAGARPGGRLPALPVERVPDDGGPEEGAVGAELVLAPRHRL